MNTTAGKLKKEILRKATDKGMDPYENAFKPSDLAIKADKYGSFSDFCSSRDTISGKWNKETILKPVEWKKNNKPHKYLLIK